MLTVRSWKEPTIHAADAFPKYNLLYDPYILHCGYVRVCIYIYNIKAMGGPIYVTYASHSSTNLFMISTNLLIEIHQDKQTKVGGVCCHDRHILPYATASWG